MASYFYDIMIHLKYLENNNKMTDDKWESYKNIIICRLINFNPAYYNSNDIGIRTLLVTKQYCIFDVIHKISNNRQLFFVQKKTDNIALLGSKKKDKPYISSKNIVLK